LVLGLQVDPIQREANIRHRINCMMRQGLANEAQMLTKQYGERCSPLRTIGYQEFWPYFRGEITIEETAEKIVHNTLAYAKRQRTWFRRNNDINWICNQADCDDLITTMLNN
jgi:tRNA dimethylallyltransferase